jgi:hypothetical protein
MTALPCEGHTFHRPTSHVNEVHHIRPLGHGGADHPDNKVRLCATGHNNVHRLLDRLLSTGGKVPGAELRTYARGERKLARDGYDRIVQNTHGRLPGKTG